MDHVDMKIAVFTNLAAAEEGVDAAELLQAQGAIFRRLTDPTQQRAIINLDGAHGLIILHILLTSDRKWHVASASRSHLVVCQVKCLLLLDRQPRNCKSLSMQKEVVHARQALCWQSTLLAVHF